MMDQTTENNKRIAKNTSLLYIRMLVTMCIGLYTSRVVLQTLGISDFGLYNVVGGIVAMFSFLNGNLAGGTQRFLSFELGTGNKQKLRKTFSTALILHIILALIILILAETLGLWFVYHKMNIGADRMNAALWVYQCSVLASMVSVIQVPFMSSLIAHEKMNIYAYMSIYDAGMKLLIVYFIQVIDYDKLILYAALILIVNVSAAIIYNKYCSIHYEECRFRFVFEKSLFKEMLSFSGWNVIGTFASACNGQGVNILLNMFFGTIVNAARGIAFQVNNILLQFVNNFQTAVNPQIVKYYANGQIVQMSRLVINNAKFAAFLLLIIAIPIFIEIEYVLRLWLGEYPKYAPLFLRIILIHSVISSMTRPLVAMVHASGKVKMVSLTSGICLLIALPVNYLFLKLGYPPEFVFIVNIIPTILEQFFETYWMRRYIGFSMKSFYLKVYCSVFPLSLILFIPPYIISSYIENDTSRFFTVGFTSIATSCIGIYFLGLNSSQRDSVLAFLKKKIFSRFK